MERKAPADLHLAVRAGIFVAVSALGGDISSVGHMQRWESFHLDGLHCGALFRDITPERLLTRVAFRLDENEVYAVESTIIREGASWRSMTYRQQPGDILVTADRGARSDASMPGYGEFLLLMRMLASNEASIDFEAVIDSVGEAPTTKASMRLMGPDVVRIPSGDERDAERVDITIGDAVTSSHWALDRDVIASDWKGAWSYPSGSAEEALEGIDKGLRLFLLHGHAEGPTA